MGWGGGASEARRLGVVAPGKEIVMPTALNNSTLASLPTHIALPRRDRREGASRIVHVGVGGFHRAHEAVYLDDLRNADSEIDWGICGVGLLPSDKVMRDSLRPQDCLYTVVSRNAEGDEARIVGSMINYLFAPDDPDAVRNVMAAPETKIVSLTITEGGYGVETASKPGSAFGVLAEALDKRRERGLPPFTVLSCDNLQSNGDKAREALLVCRRWVWAGSVLMDRAKRGVSELHGGPDYAADDGC